MAGNAGNRNNSRSSDGVNNNGVSGSVGDASYAEAGSAASGAAASFIQFGNKVEEIAAALDLKIAEAGLGVVPMQQISPWDIPQTTSFGPGTDPEGMPLEAPVDVVGESMQQLKEDVAVLNGKIKDIPTIKNIAENSHKLAVHALQRAGEAERKAGQALQKARSASAVELSNAETPKYVQDGMSQGGGS